MIDTETLAVFFEEIGKTANVPAKTKLVSAPLKALIGVTALGGVAAGVKGDQARRDLLRGRQMRRGV